MEDGVLAVLCRYGLRECGSVRAMSLFEAGRLPPSLISWPSYGHKDRKECVPTRECVRVYAARA